MKNETEEYDREKILTEIPDQPMVPNGREYR